MQNYKLIFIEGIPGSGKSTTAQFVSNIFTRNNIPHKWWYEEAKGHPVYLFDNQESMQQVVENLSNGNYRLVIDIALKRWIEFSISLQNSNEIVIVDSCLLGYLTWSLFPNNVPKKAILEYVSEVEEIVKQCNPVLIYFYQDDIAAAIKKICLRRSGATENNFIRAATESSYGKTKGLTGFNGLVSYWQDYRALTDESFEGLSFPKISINNTEGDWLVYYRDILNFLGVNEKQNRSIVQDDLQRFVGSYYSKQDGEKVCWVVLDGGRLIVDGLRQVWTKTTLIPKSLNSFDVESLPFQVKFEEDERGIMNMYLSGCELLDGPVDMIFTREENM